jgi:hypothetical protein
VCSRIIDGDRWIAERLKFLRERLAGDLSADERSACEAEVEALSQERGLRARGRRVLRMPRRFRGKDPTG